ncbi:MAG: anthranilate phosphoribosyltransferase [Halanaerobiales bacterium]
MFANYFEKVVRGNNLETDEMESVMSTIMEGKVSECQIAGMLIGLRMKGETIDEITGAARVMRKKAININCNNNYSIDTCGTGGDGSGTFNISTTVALVLAGAGLTVAKHGNRSVSSKSGSADVLEKLGVKLNLKPEQVEKCVNEIDIGFLFAPHFHKAMKYAVKPRKELGMRTIFNVLGPLTNPAFVNYQVLGVYHPTLVRPLAEVLKNLGVKSAMVVNGHNSVDELTLSGENKVAYLNEGKIKEMLITPEQIGIERASLKDLAGGQPEDNKNIIIDILNGKIGPHRNVVLFNSAAAFVVTGYADSWKQGVKIAEDIIDSGKALSKLNQLVEFTNSQELVV